MTPQQYPRWITSSHSDNGGQCVEVATNLAASHGRVPVRDSKHPHGPALSLSADAFTSLVESLVEGIRSGARGPV